MDKQKYNGCPGCPRLSGRMTSCIFPESTRSLTELELKNGCKLHPNHPNHTTPCACDDLIFQLENINISGNDTYGSIDNIRKILISLCKRCNTMD